MKDKDKDKGCEDRPHPPERPRSASLTPWWAREPKAIKYLPPRAKEILKQQEDEEKAKKNRGS